MKRTYLLALAPIALLNVSGCAVGDDTSDRERAVGARIPAQFVSADGERIGTAVLSETAGGVLVDVELRGLEPGWHGFHIHERGDCSAQDFESAGGHYRVDRQAHGFMVEDGPHAGDLPNLFVNADGTVKAQALASGVSLRTGDNALSDHNGSAIVVHAAADDYRSQPSGESGERVACAEIG